MSLYPIFIAIVTGLLQLKLRESVYLEESFILLQLLPRHVGALIFSRQLNGLGRHPYENSILQELLVL